MVGRRDGAYFGLLVLLAFFYAGFSRPAGIPRSSFRHVIFFIGDGMSIEAEIAASRYLYGSDAGLAWQALPGHAYVATWDVTAYNFNAKLSGRPLYTPAAFSPSLGYNALEEGPVPRPCSIQRDGDHRISHRRGATESASAATAMATGYKTESGRIAWLPGGTSGGRLVTIAEEYRTRRGAAIGVVSTVPFSHATPAAFVSHNLSRNNYYTGFRGLRDLGIADEIILRVKPDVVIGGGHPLFDNPTFDIRKGYISEGLLRTLRSSPDYVLAEREEGVDGGRTLAQAAEKAAAIGKKLFGLFGGSGGNFAIPVPANTPGSPIVRRPGPEDPSLKDATLAALTLLGRNPNGFFLMVEQGDIDWANHDNDFRGMIGTMADLEEAVKGAIAFVDRPGDDVDWTNTVLLVTADHASGGLCLNPGRPLGAGVLPRQVPRPMESGAVAVLEVNGKSKVAPKAAAYRSPYIYPDGEVNYGTGGHSNELVTLAVSAPASLIFLKYKGWWYPGPIIDNTQITAALREALALGAEGFTGRAHSPTIPGR